MKHANRELMHERISAADGKSPRSHEDYKPARVSRSEVEHRGGDDRGFIIIQRTARPMKD